MKLSFSPAVTIGYFVKKDAKPALMSRYSLTFEDYMLMRYERKKVMAISILLYDLFLGQKKVVDAMREKLDACGVKSDHPLLKSSF